MKLPTINIIICKVVIPVCFASIFIVIAYFILSPLYFLYPEQVFIHKLTNLSSARNYYTVLSTGINALIGFIGVCLGFFYYFHKIDVENNKSESDRVRSRINVIIDHLNKYDEYVDEILEKRFDDAKRLSYLRSKIRRGPEIINALLQHNDKLVKGFNTDDVMTILQVFSFVEKSDQIQNLDIDDLLKADLKNIRSDYIDQIQEARKTCYLKSK